MPARSPKDAIDLLKEDHREVEGLFSRFEDAGDTQRVSIAEKICIALTVHAQVEEELFYPAAKEALEERGVKLVAEAEVEHGSLKQLIAEIDGSSPDDESFEARLTVLKEYVQHHVREEEEQLMPMVRKTDVDLGELGEEISELKSKLMEKMEPKKSASKKKSDRVQLPAAAGRKSSARKTSKRATRRSTPQKKSSRRRMAS